MQRTAKYWAKPDELYMNDVRETPVYPAFFNKEHHKQNYKTGVADKVSNIKIDIKDPTMDDVLLRHNYGKGSWAT